MTIITPKADAVRAHADNVELAGVDFLDVNDRVGARGYAVHTIRLTFIDGAVARLTPREFKKLDDYEFRLRPVLNN